MERSEPLNTTDEIVKWGNHSGKQSGSSSRWKHSKPSYYRTQQFHSSGYSPETWKRMSTQAHVNVHNGVTHYSEKEETKQLLSLTGTTEVCRPALYPSGHTVVWWQSQDYQIYQCQCCFYYSNFPPVTNDTKGSKRKGVRANRCWLIIFNILKPIGCQPCVKVFGHYYLLCPFPDERLRFKTN